MIIITGITGGIGKFLFDKFSSIGEQIIGTYHLTKPEGKIYENSFELDITNFVEVEKFMDAINFAALVVDEQAVSLICPNVIFYNF